MAAKRKTDMREVVTDPPVWRRPPAAMTKIDRVRLFRNHNPIFTLKELNETLGADHAATVEQLVAKGELKRQATGIFSRPEYDQTHEGIRYLIAINGVAPAPTASLAKQAAKAAARIAAVQEADLRRRPLPERIMSGRAKVFSTREAWDRVGEDPRGAIAQLQAGGLLEQVHPGLYVKRGIATFGPEVMEWSERHARRRGDIVRSIDASQMQYSRRDGAGPPRVMSITMLEKDSTFPRDRIRINFQRMGWIQAVAGGPGNKYAAWQSHTARTGLTKDAAAFVAEQIFGRDVRWGDLIDLTRKHATDPDRNPLTSPTLPRFRSRSYLDYEPRMGENQGSIRCRSIRDEADAHADRRPGRPCILYADHREDKRIVDALQGIPWLHVVPVTLETGDFVAQWGPAPSEMLVFERKTAADFDATILDRDLESQLSRLEALSRQGARCFLIQQGDPFGGGPLRVGPGGAPSPRTVPGPIKVDLYAEMAVRGIRVVPVPTWQMCARAIATAVFRALPLDEAALPPAWDDPKTPVDNTPAGPCANQDNIAAERPEGPSSE